MDIRRTIVSAQYSENKSLLPHSIWTANLNMILYMVYRIIWIVSSLILTIFLDNAILMKVLSCKIAYLKKNKKPPNLKKLFYIINVSCTVAGILMKFPWFISCLWWSCLRILLEFSVFLMEGTPWYWLA